MSGLLAVKHELLVRCLDAWTPAALHGHKRVTYVDCSTDAASATAALRVFGEFADLLERRTLTMIGFLSLVPDPPPGLVMLPISSYDELGPAIPKGAPVFGWFDGFPPTTGAAAHKGSEILAVSSSLPQSFPFPLGCRVELVDAAGGGELLTFGTSSEKALEKFKDELWALDEYAGIRLRDPADPDGTLLDISVQPNPAPLRRSLLAQVQRTEGSTVAELRSWALRETIFRVADVTKALQGIVSSGAVGRDPAVGRLSPTTRILPANR
jgi:hypothetical protein